MKTSIFSTLNNHPNNWDDKPKSYKMRLSNEKNFAIEFFIEEKSDILDCFNNAFIDFAKRDRYGNAYIHIYTKKNQWVNVGYGSGKKCYFLPNKWSAEELLKRIEKSYYSAYALEKFLFGELPEMLQINLEPKEG